MKYSITLLLLCLTASIWAQQNFTVENNYLTWTKEYSSTLSSEDIKNKLQNHPALRTLANDLKGNLGSFSKNCEKQGTAIFMLYAITAYALITPTPKGYTVRVDAITFKNTNIVLEIQSIPAEDYLLTANNAKIRTNKQASKDLSCLNETFTQLFAFN